MIKTITTSKIWNGGEITRDMYEQMQGAMFDSARDIAEQARALAPRGGEDRPTYKGRPVGHLQDTIRARPGRKRSQLEALLHGVASGDYETALPVAFVFAGRREAGVYWAHFVEYGTYWKSAHPFLRPAADANFNAVLAHAARAGRRVVLKRRRERAAARRAQGG